MPRTAREVMPGVPMHVVQRGHNREACFFCVDDCLRYLSLLRAHAADAECAVHAYVLMTNHVHLLLTPGRADSLARLMKPLAQSYAYHVNLRCTRRSSVWDGRYRSTVIHDESHVLSCSRYIELNPVRAGMVQHPREYRWSSYCINAQGRASSLVQPHAVYRSLGTEDGERRRAYMALFEAELDRRWEGDSYR